MPDVRPAHHTVSLMNQPTEPFNGPGHSLYGQRGPQRAAPDYGGRRAGEPPTSLSEHVDDALAKVKDLSAKQRAAVKAAMTVMLRDIGFNKMMAEQSQAHAIPMDQGRLL
jgi:hypothetical protein